MTGHRKNRPNCGTTSNFRSICGIGPVVAIGLVVGPTPAVSLTYINFILVYIHLLSKSFHQTSFLLFHRCLWCSVPLHLNLYFLFTCLAHLSLRLTRWANSIAMVRRPHMNMNTSEACLPSQSWSNLMSGITGMGKRLQKVLEHIW